jgi:hypothetical protein
MEPIITFKSDPLFQLQSKTYLKVLPWDQLKLVVGRRYQIKVADKVIHKSVLKHAKKYKVEDIPEEFLVVAFNRNRAAALRILKENWRWLERNMFVGVYIFEQQGFPGNAGEQPGGVTDSSNSSSLFHGCVSTHVGNGVEGPSILSYAGNPLPSHLRTATDKDSIKELAMYVASAYQHILIMEDETDMRKAFKNNELIMRGVMALNPNIDTNHGFAIIGGVNTVRHELKRKSEAAAGKQAKLFS